MAEQQFILHLNLAIKLASQLGTLVHTWHVSRHGGRSKSKLLFKHTGFSGAGVIQGDTGDGAGAGAGAAFEQAGTDAQTGGDGVQVGAGAGAGADVQTPGAGTTNF